MVLRLIFTTEVVVKMFAYMNHGKRGGFRRLDSFRHDNRVDVMAPFTPEGLLILRVLRLFRVLKEFNSLPQLQMIVNGLIDAWRHGS